MSNPNKCELCGKPMPKGEEMFKYHGYSGNCPKPPTAPTPDPLDEILDNLIVKSKWSKPRPSIEDKKTYFVAGKKQAKAKINSLMVSRQAVEAALDKAEKDYFNSDPEVIEPSWFTGYEAAIDDIRAALGMGK